MATKAGPEADSLSNTSTLLPQLRSSRRGSLSSLSSVNVLGKETVSLALDQIHTSASQSGQLTTFNEYTSPPPPSSGPDNKSIAEELQGGISGLYNRFRASVGNVKDVAGPYSQDESSDRTSLEESRVATPSSTLSAGMGRSSKRASETTSRQEPSPKRLSETESTEKAIEATVERSATLKPPPTSSKPVTPTVRKGSTIDKKTDEYEEKLSHLKQLKMTDVIHLDTTPFVPQDHAIGKESFQNVDRPDETFSRGPAIIQMSNKQPDSLQPTLQTPASLSTNGPAQQQEQDSAIEINETAALSRYQHLELPTRKSLAPPVVSRSNSPRPSMSRASSSETNADSLLNLPRHSSPQNHAFHSGSARYSSPVRNSPLAGRASQHLQDTRMMTVFSQAKSKVLSKEYWMKDENAKDCFGCGDAFSTFRRKHHCRTCGQIFDAKCTSVISGGYFSQPGTLRVCKPCEGIIKGEDDSSEFSDDGNFALPGFRPRHGSAGANDTLASPYPDSASAEKTQTLSGNPDRSVPTMSIPATRKAGEKASRKPAVVEIGAERILTRPSSSRSLKSAFGSRSHTPGHRRHNSRNQFPRVLKPAYEDNAPFHQEALERKPPNRLATFHDDSIIDPDLAPYLSDDQSSGDEQVSIMAALNGGELSASVEDRPGWDASAISTRRARFRLGDKGMSNVTFASRDADAQSLTGSRSSRPGKRRTFSTSSTTHLRPSPRSYRMSAMNNASTSSLRESALDMSAIQATSPPIPSGISRMLRSSSMRGASAPTIELNDASLQHVQKLLTQLLGESGLSGVSEWEKALLPVLLRATDDVCPDVQNGDDMDIRHYVKLKKIPGGRSEDTAYVSGPVFTKNLALKTMPRSIPHPNILILTFPLEYARHQQHFMSLEPVIRQEREFLQNLVNRIAALRPQLLLVERHVSGLALEFLEQANVATAYNVKISVLEAVARCCQTKIISSIDKLAIKPAQAGKCASFYLKTYLYDGRKKTYMFLSGSAKELGCTIVLRGADVGTLKKIKSITEFMIYVVYNLKLETCLMKDEYARIPSDLDIGSLSLGPRPLFDPDRTLNNGDTQASKDQTTSQNQSLEQSTEDVKQATQNTITGPSDAHNTSPNLPDEDSVPDDIPMPTFYTNMVEEHRTKILSASPFVKFMQPYLLMRAREQERRLDYLKRLRDQDLLAMQTTDNRSKGEKFDLIKPEMVHKRMPNASKKVREVLHAVHDAEYDKALYNYQTQSKQWETYIAGNIDMFNPYAHQNIAVLYSVVCTSTTIPCSGPDLVALSFYNEQETDVDFEADCTLGQYVEDLSIGASAICTANGCEKQMMEHHRQYVHGEAQVSVFIERYPCKIPGFTDTILMWSICRKCDKETEVMHMSENTWKYSFGKYLELSFWSTDMKAQGDNCPHDLHRDYLRYFGFKDMAVRIHYDPITLLEIIVPRARVTWKVDNDLRFKNEVFLKIEGRLNKFMTSVKARIKSISANSVLPEKVGDCKQEVERLGKKAAEDHHGLLLKLRERYMGSKHYEIIPLNQAVRALQEKVVEWDNIFNNFDRDFFPSERDIRRLTTLQLKRIFLDRDASSTSLTSEGSNPTIECVDEKPLAMETVALSPGMKRVSPDKAHQMVNPTVKDEASKTDHNSSTQSSKDHEKPLEAHSTNKPSKKSVEMEEQEARRLDPTDDSEGLARTQIESSSRPDEDRISEAVEGKVQGSDVPKQLKSESKQAGQMPSARALSNVAQASAIPRPHTEQCEDFPRRNGITNLAGLGSQPTDIHETRESLSSVVPCAEIGYADEDGPNTATHERSAGVMGRINDKTITDRLGLHTLKSTTMAAQSMIPRSIAARKRDTRVSHLAKHFEQLSREFEKERLKDRRQRNVQSRRSRAHPMRASKPIVQVYRSVNEAVEEKVPSDEDVFSSDPSTIDNEPNQQANIVAHEKVIQEPMSLLPTEQNTADNTEAEEAVADDSKVVSDAEMDAIRSDDEQYLMEGMQLPTGSDQHDNIISDESQLDLKLDLPKHEKTSLMKMLTNFWAERSASGWEPLEYPLHATDHIFADSDIIVREDEPSSLIAFALSSEDYQKKMTSIINNAMPSAPEPNKRKYSDSLLSPSQQVQIEDSLLRPTGTHLKYQFSEGSAKMLCKIFYAEQFDAVRRKCGVSERMAESLSRCMKWDSKGGKTNSVFLKTLDDRFVLKSLSPIETQAFLRFAPAYFRIISESLFHELPSVIAKMLGFYQIIIKNPHTGVEFSWFLLLMENLFYDRSPNRIFDLKGSMRNRRIQSTGEQNEVLLDENMVEFIYESPLFAREHSKKLLRASVWNDTLFLSRQNVMDYSLMIAIDETKKELVVGIIDCIRTYTWDKKLESWIKDRGKNRPTVTSPKEYKSRFREAMGRYVLQAPNCWHQFQQQIETKPLRRSHDDPGEDKEAHVLDFP